MGQGDSPTPLVLNGHQLALVPFKDRCEKLGDERFELLIVIHVLHQDIDADNELAVLQIELDTRVRDIVLTDPLDRGLGNHNGWGVWIALIEGVPQVGR